MPSVTKTSSTGQSFPAGTTTSKEARFKPGPNNDNPQSVIPPLPKGARNNRNDNLFTQRPLTGTYVSKHGIEMPLPGWHSFDGTAAVLEGTADLDDLDKLLAGTGYKAVRTDGNRGFVQIFCDDYTDTFHGPYEGILLNISASQEEKYVPWKNAMTPVAATLDPETTSFLVKLPVSKGALGPLDYGREILGMDKFEANIDLRNEGDSSSVRLSDLSGKPVLDGEFKPNKGDAGTAKAMQLLAENIGPAGIQMLIEAAKSDSVVKVPALVKAAELPGHPPQQLTYVSKFHPQETSLFEGGDRLDVYRGTEFGNIIDDMDFEPTAVMRDSNFRGVVEVGSVLEP